MAVDTVAVPGRLNDSRDIAAVLRGGQRRAGRLVVLHGLAAAARSTAASDDVGRNDARVAVVASRKVGSAVARNRAKRLLREASHRVRWEVDTDLVLVARNACASSTMPEVLAELQELATALAFTRGTA